IGENKVDRRHAGRACVALPCHAQRGRPAREYQKPFARMSHQVEKDVDLVLSNLVSQLLVGQRIGDAPALRGGSKPGGHFVSRLSVVITNDLALRLVEMFDGPEGQKGGRVNAEI